MLILVKNAVDSGTAVIFTKSTNFPTEPLSSSPAPH
jgi:hypothetical protein